MTRRRWSDNDHSLGPFTYAKDKYKTLEFILGSGDGDEYPGCYLRLRAFGHVLIANLPSILRPWREKVMAPQWNTDGTAQRLGCDWYWRNEERQYGFSYSGSGALSDGGFLQVFYGCDDNWGKVRQHKGYFTPWNNWRHVRRSLYGLNGEHIYTEPDRKWVRKANKLDDKTWADIWSSHYEEVRKAEVACPTASFLFTDFDGELLTAKTRIEERQWEFGTGWFKWLSWFRKPIIHRSLNIEFSGETGRRKGSWKGGTTGHSIEMLTGELHESAFKRYCEEHEMAFKERN